MTCAARSWACGLRHARRSAATTWRPTARRQASSSFRAHLEWPEAESAGRQACRSPRQNTSRPHSRYRLPPGFCPVGSSCRPMKKRHDERSQPTHQPRLNRFNQRLRANREYHRLLGGFKNAVGVGQNEVGAGSRRSAGRQAGFFKSTGDSGAHRVLPRRYGPHPEPGGARAPDRRAPLDAQLARGPF
jgi:hypothetical protein